MEQGRLIRIRFASWTERVPRAVANYAALALLDLGFTLLAFTMGIKEGNPILAWYQERGLFEAVKIGSTLVVILLGFYLWNLRVVRFVIYVANLVMFGVLVVHLVFWIQVLNGLKL